MKKNPNEGVDQTAAIDNLPSDAPGHTFQIGDPPAETKKAGNPNEGVDQTAAIDKVAVQDEPATAGHWTPIDDLEEFLGAIDLKAPIVKIRNEEQPSPDRRTWHEIGPEGFVHVEEGIFRTASGYDDNWLLNVKSAAERCLKHDFGGKDKSGSPTFDQLPPFDQQNRVIVIVAVLPAGEA